MVGKFPAADSVSGKAKVLAFRYNGVNVFFLYSLLTSTAAANFVLHVFKALLEGRELRNCSVLSVTREIKSHSMVNCFHFDSLVHNYRSNNVALRK